MKPALILLALTSIAFAQGNLTPPGAPGPTMRSLDQIEPRTPLTQTHTPGNATCVFRITQPGSYYLPGNIKPPAGKHGILIALMTPGVVELDLMGFTVDGSDAGATASAMIFTNDTIGRMELYNGTISNFAGTACLQAFPMDSGVWVFENITWLRNGNAVNTPGRLLLSNSSISGGTGIPIRMGSESVLSRVDINQTSQGGTTTDALLQGSGVRMEMEEISFTFQSLGGTHNGLVQLGPDSRISGMTARISGGTFTGPLFSNTGGSTAFFDVFIELDGVTAPSACVNYLGQSRIPGGPQVDSVFHQITWDIIARNCTFSQAVVRLSAAENPLGSLSPGVKLEGTTSAPLVVGADGTGLTVAPRISIGTSATLTGPVINVAGNGNTVSATISGVPAGGTGILISSGQSCEVSGCVIAARGNGLATAIRLGPSAFQALCKNEKIRNFPAGSTIVDNQGGASNAIAPILTTPAAIAGNTNPFAIIVH